MIKVGILGTGFGKYHAELYKKIEGFEPVMIYGRDEARLTDIEKQLGIKTTTSIEEIITNHEIDLIDICLPTSLHAKWAIESLNNKKIVLCETPLAYERAEAEEIKKAAEENGRAVFVDLFDKFSAPHHTAINKI
ncbi:Gfo/Idh/MocA family protein [Paenibacillus xerothermodurans]|uniref:Gfo/Idh/MocA family oxidoreductase n=1 Tax=Paenibacillus xerothermodurans TaxID=1977292 RepID=A0A2W1P3H7_PAEXE|nr:Gfo/Idh/MocA family oxidoreductase [Paenibacillus xerothermodurans]PZE22262.1 gfo/Idh/MocA family oxidoreductase [Paenibacillus xerothermodurans]